MPKLDGYARSPDAILKTRDLPVIFSATHVTSGRQFRDEPARCAHREADRHRRVR
jgi:hypothetical protein